MVCYKGMAKIQFTFSFADKNLSSTILIRNGLSQAKFWSKIGQNLAYIGQVLFRESNKGKYGPNF